MLRILKIENSPVIHWRNTGEHRHILPGDSREEKPVFQETSRYLSRKSRFFSRWKGLCTCFRLEHFLKQEQTYSSNWLVFWCSNVVCSQSTGPERTGENRIIKRAVSSSRRKVFRSCLASWFKPYFLPLYTNKRF